MTQNRSTNLIGQFLGFMESTGVAYWTYPPVRALKDLCGQNRQTLVIDFAGNGPFSNPWFKEFARDARLVVRGAEEAYALREDGEDLVVALAGQPPERMRATTIADFEALRSRILAWNPTLADE